MKEKLGFEWALQQLRQGKKVCREDWNGKGMFIVLQKGYPNGIPINENTEQATGIARGTVCYFLPYLMMKVVCAKGHTFVPWLASQSDLLETDWGYPLA